MCRRIQCSSCGKPTYAGCGRHIEQVLRDVEPDKRCQCRETRQPKTVKPLALLERLFGRK